MKKNHLLGYLSMALFLIFFSCDQQGEIEVPQSTIMTKSQIEKMSCGESMTVTLTAGQHIDAGTVTVSNDDTYLYVTYETVGNWYLEETHLFVGNESDIPLNKSGNPRIGHFPYHGDHGSVQTYTFPPIALADLGDTFVVVAHAVVNGEGGQSETAFGCGDKEFPGNRWGCYFDYTKRLCEEGDCLNAFAKKLDDELSACINTYIDGNAYNAWSSYMQHNWLMGVTLNNSAFELPIYLKEVDDCSIPQPHIGHVEFSLADNLLDIKVKYVLNDEYKDDYEISEINLYSGPEENPFNADGSMKSGVSGDNFFNGAFVEDIDIIIPWWSGEANSKVYIIPHAKICNLK